MAATSSVGGAPIVAITGARGVGVASGGSATLSMTLLVLLTPWDMALQATASACAAASVSTAVAWCTTAGARSGT